MEENSLLLWDEGGEGCLWKLKSRIEINEGVRSVYREGKSSIVIDETGDEFFREAKI